MKKTILYIVMATLCLFFKASGQFYKPSDKTIRMGDTLPESFYQTIHQAVRAQTGEVTTLLLKQYRNKLVILDFWASWCKPCLLSLKKLDTLTKTLNNKNVVVIPVTYQSASEARTVYNKLGINFISVVSDTLLAKMFPHNSIPHQVWIKNGKVIAVPFWTYSKAVNILKALQDQPTNMLMMNKDAMLDPKKQLFTGGNGNSPIYYKNKFAAFAHYLPDHPAQLPAFIRQGDTSILYAVNLTLPQLCYFAFKAKIFPAFDYKGRSQQAIKWEISDELKKQLLAKPKLSPNGDSVQDALYTTWLNKNNYCYQLRFPEPIRSSEALYFLQQDLNRLLGQQFRLQASISRVGKYKYAVVRLAGTRANAESLLKSRSAISRQPAVSDNISYVNSFYREMPNWIQKGVSLARPDLDIEKVIDSTGINAELKIDMVIPKSIDEGDISVIQNTLKTYGLRLTFEDQPVPVLIISEKKVTQVLKKSNTAQ